MLKRKNKGNVSADAKKKPSLDIAGQRSSVDTESEHLFPDTESEYLFPDTESELLFPDTESEHLFPDTESEHLFPDTEREHLFPDTESEHLFPDTESEHVFPDTESEHLFPDRESTNTSTGAINGNSTLDTDDLDTVDTLALARAHRETQGPWEAEYSYGGEADLHRHYNACTKNPGHKNFIPVDKFSIEDLPDGYRDPDVVDYIRAQSDLTVRVTVKYISDRRPATVPGSDKPYPCYANRGQKIMTVGTGWVQAAFICEEKIADIHIVTAKHVVFDDIEAEHTTCHLFFDSGGTPDTCSGVDTLTGMECAYEGIEIDACMLQTLTENLELGNRLKQTLNRRNTLRSKLSSKLVKISCYGGRRIPLDMQPLAFIVSHPHGCRKHISLGRWTSVNNSTVSSCQYTTATCPGSSGARVCIPHEHPSEIIEILLENTLGHHCGASDELTVQKKNELQINYSKTEVDELFKGNSCVSVEIWPVFEGSWNYNFGCVDEEDLHKHVDTCQRNPALQNFCPVDKFSMDYLPPFCRKDETMEAIKIVSHLTVQVSVTCVSEERPKTIPGTDTPYPWYKTRGCNLLRVGCGWISDVDIRLKDDVSPLRCWNCFENLPQKTDGAYIYVTSATRLVYDRMEAAHTTCRLFFDSGETPDLCKDVVTFTDMAHYCNHGIDDTCTMVYAINDQTLADRLKDMIWRYKMSMGTLEELLYRTYRGMKTDQEISNPGIPTCIMVSHPHGRAKQICVSCVGNHDNADTSEDKNPGVSITCPGSLGAPVIVLHRGTFYPYSVESVMPCGPGYGDSRYTVEVVHEKWEEGEPGNWKQWRYDDEPRMNTKKGCPGGCLYNVIADASKVLAIVDTC